jgi:hypothetical protein
MFDTKEAEKELEIYFTVLFIVLLCRKHKREEN